MGAGNESRPPATRLDDAPTGADGANVTKRGRGRPRDPSIDRLLMDAALRELASHGFGGMSIDRIARRSGIHKPAIYRRYRDKTRLALAALERLAGKHKAELTGDIVTDLTLVLSEVADNLERAGALPLLGTMLAELQRDPNLIGTYRERVVNPRIDLLNAILANAERTGQIRAGVDYRQPIQLLTGYILASFMLFREETPGGDHIADAVRVAVSTMR